jgi:hypothetical protein
MSVPLEPFRQQGTASGLRSAEEVSACINQLPSGSRPQDNRQFVQRGRAQR